MNCYFLRCPANAVDVLKNDLAALGVLEFTDEPIGDLVEGEAEPTFVRSWRTAPGFAFDEIGQVSSPTGAMTKDTPPVPVMAVRTDPVTKQPWHLVNVMASEDLIARADALGLDLGVYCNIDADRAPVPPKEPRRIFAGWAPPVEVQVDYDPGAVR